jgi:two-component system response regulator PhoP
MRRAVAWWAAERPAPLVRVLIVEDEPTLRQALARRLRALGHVVDEAADGREGAYMGEEFPVEVAVVDLGLPGGDGMDLIRRWRARGRHFPILVLTARDRWEQKVAALESGADDYLTKPAQVEELVARLRALVRRSHGWSSDLLKLGPWRLDVAAQRLSVEGRPVDLTAYEYRLLEVLMREAGTVLGKAQLSERLYPDDDERDSNVLEVLLGRLRRKLVTGDGRQPIRTLRGRGYLFDASRVDDG